MPTKVVYIKGQQFGRWTVMGQARRPPRLKNKTIHWRCRCSCGTVKVISGASLRCGTSRSCGCGAAVAARRTAPGVSGFNFLFKKYRNHAKYRDLPFRLTRKTFKQLTSACCFYCGTPPSTRCVPANVKTDEGRRHSVYVYNGIDRVDSDRGYTRQNCVTACLHCNRAKSDRPLADFIAWVYQAAFHLLANDL